MVYRTKAGIGNVASYQVSGRPFITGSTVDTNKPNGGEVNIQFPTITKSFTIINRSSNDLYIHFDSRANSNVVSQHHFITLRNIDDSFGFDVRCKEVYVSMSGSSGTGSFELHAELTGIEKEQMGEKYVSGSGINAR